MRNALGIVEREFNIPTYHSTEIGNTLQMEPNPQGKSFYIARRTDVINDTLEIPARKYLRFIEFGGVKGPTTYKTTSNIRVYVSPNSSDLCQSDERIFVFEDESGKAYKGKIKLDDDTHIKLRITGVLQGGKAEEMIGAFA